MLAPLTIDELQNRFYLEKCPFWFVYEANTKRKMVGRFRDDEPGASEDDKLDYSWMQLEALLEGFPYGRVEVVLKKTESSGVDKSPSYTVEWGVLPQRGGRGAVVSGGIANSGAGNWQMMQYFIEQQNKMTAQYHQAQLENLQLQFQNQLLEQGINASTAPSMQEELLKEGIGAAKMLIANWTARPTAPPVHVGTLGQRQETAAPSSVPAATASVKADHFVIDAALGYVEQITDIFPQYDRMDIMKALYAICKANAAFIAVKLGEYINSEKEQGVLPKQTKLFSVDQAMGYIQHITALFPQFSRMDVLESFHALAKNNPDIIATQLVQYLGNGGE